MLNNPFYCRTATEVALWVSSRACKAQRMMKLQISMGRETAGFVPVTNNNLEAVRNANPRFAEPLYIGAPTENPGRGLKSMKIKRLVAAGSLAVLCAMQTFAVPPLGTAF